MEDKETREARLTFHSIHRKNTKVGEKGKLARRLYRGNHGMSFLNRPIAVNECIHFEFRLLGDWEGSLHVGCTLLDPGTMGELPEEGIPYLAGKSGFWLGKLDAEYWTDEKSVKCLPGNYTDSESSDAGNESSDTDSVSGIYKNSENSESNSENSDQEYIETKIKIAIRLTNDGRIRHGRIGRKECNLITGLPPSQEVWLMFDLFENLDCIRILGHETIEGKISRKYWLSFHPNHGKNIKISWNGRLARRVRSFCHGVAFLRSPLAVNKGVHIECRLRNVWGGGLCVGCTIHDPTTIVGLPRQSIPCLADKPGFWVEELNILPWMYTRGRVLPDVLRNDTEPETSDTDSESSETDYGSSSADTNDTDTDSDAECQGNDYMQNTEVTMGFYHTADGRIMYGRDRRKKHNFITGLPPSKKVWLLFDLFGNVDAVGILGKCRLCICGNDNLTQVREEDQLAPEILPDDKENTVNGCAATNEIKRIHHQEQHENTTDETDDVHAGNHNPVFVAEFTNATQYNLEWEFMDSEQYKFRRLQQRFRKRVDKDWEPSKLIPWLQEQLEEPDKQLQSSHQFETKEAQQWIHRNLLMLKMPANLEVIYSNLWAIWFGLPMCGLRDIKDDLFRVFRHHYRDASTPDEEWFYEERDTTNLLVKESGQIKDCMGNYRKASLQGRLKEGATQPKNWVLWSLSALMGTIYQFVQSVPRNCYAHKDQVTQAAADFRNKCVDTLKKNWEQDISPEQVNTSVSVESMDTSGLQSYSLDFIKKRLVQNLNGDWSLDLSDIGMTVLPESLWELDCISDVVDLDISCNFIRSISHKIQLFTGLSNLDLNFNRVKELPTEICLLEHLDSINMIGNPSNIPYEILREGANAIKNYLMSARESQMVLNNIFRVPVLGNTGAGKTSFIRTLLAKTPTLADPDDRTYVVDRRTWQHVSTNEEKDVLEIRIDDFGGHECYKQIYALFLARRSVPLVFAKSDTYSNKSHGDDVTTFVETISDKLPNAPICLALTHTDVLREDKTKEKQHMMVKYANKHEKSICDQIDFNIRDLTGRIQNETSADVKTALEKDLAHLSSLKEQRPVFPNKAYAISAKSYTGVHDIASEIVHKIEDRTIFPVEKVPLSWLELGNILRDCNEDDNLCLSWDTVLALAEKVKLIRETEICTALDYLHRCGDILWYPSGALLKRHVFHDPNKLVAILKTIINHDIKQITHTDCRFQNLDTGTFEKMKDDLLQRGHLSRTLLHCLWKKFSFRDHQFNALLELLVKFGMCFPVEKTKTRFEAEKCEKLMFPWILSDFKPPDLPSDQPVAAGEMIIAIRLIFTSKCPPSFFNSLVVKCNMFVEKRRDWKNGMFAVDDDENIILLELTETTPKEYIQLSVRGKDSASMWHQALQIHLEMLRLLHQWPGVVRAFCVLCPKCVKEEKEQPHSFSAEYLWNPTSKSTFQCLEDLLHQDIDAKDIYPTKEVLLGVAKDDRPERALEGEEFALHRHLFVLIMTYGTMLMRRKFEQAIMPLQLGQWLFSNQELLQSAMKAQSKWQYRKLFPDSGEFPTYDDIDMTLMVSMLSKVPTNVDPPKYGWSKPPHPDDNTTGANILRLRNLRNDPSVSHTTSATLTEDDFEALWQEAEKVLHTLGGDRHDMRRIKCGEYGWLRRKQPLGVANRGSLFWLDLYSYLDVGKFSIYKRGAFFWLEILCYVDLEDRCSLQQHYCTAAGRDMK